MRLNYDEFLISLKHVQDNKKGSELKSRTCEITNYADDTTDLSSYYHNLSIHRLPCFLSKHVEGSKLYYYSLS